MSHSKLFIPSLKRKKEIIWIGENAEEGILDSHREKLTRLQEAKEISKMRWTCCIYKAKEVKCRDKFNQIFITSIEN